MSPRYYCPGLPIDPLPCGAQTPNAGALCRACWEREALEVGIPMIGLDGSLTLEASDDATP